MDNEELRRQAIQTMLKEIEEFLSWIVEAQEYVPMNEATKKVVSMVISIQKDWKSRWN